jgi:hypothetical protein
MPRTSEIEGGHSGIVGSLYSTFNVKVVFFIPVVAGNVSVAAELAIP